MLIYTGIFVFKIIEEALRTLRIIVVSNGKKKLGAILQFFIALIWIIVTGSVITGVKEDMWKIFFYALGSLIGSYIGSELEGRIALGTNVVMAKISNINAERITINLPKYKITKIKDKDKDKTLIMIVCPRKKTDKIISLIRNYDKKCNIITEKVKSFS